MLLITSTIVDYMLLYFIKKEKFVMDTKILEFENTLKTLEEIDQELLVLQKKLSEKKEKISNLRTTATKSVGKIDNLIKELEKVI